MVEFAHREALLMRTDALTASRRARKKRFLTGFAYQDDAPVAGEALAVSRRMRGRNLLRAAKLFGAAAVLALMAGLAITFLSSGIDVSFLVPDGLSEFASSANMPAHSVLQPNLADFGSVQQEPWWTVLPSARDLGRTYMGMPQPFRGWVTLGGVFVAASLTKAALGGWSKSNKTPHNPSEDDHEI